ncbi:MAG: hypothetical protein OEV44_14325 [Spirochaetota bacterium]|nr:hypothetical protein [Spirochaetota bacterium]
MEKEVKKKAFQNEKSQKETIKEIRENEIYKAIEIKWQSLNKSNREKLMNVGYNVMPYRGIHKTNTSKLKEFYNLG